MLTAQTDGPNISQSLILILWQVLYATFHTLHSSKVDIDRRR